MDALSALLSRAARELATSTLEELATLLERGASAAAIERALSSPRAREFWRQLYPFYEASNPASGGALALGLRVARCGQEWHEAGAPELVWTGPLGEESGSRRTEAALLDVVRAAREVLWLVTYALYPVPALRAELDGAVARGVQLRVVAESPDTHKIKHSGLIYWRQFLPPQTHIYEWPVSKRAHNEAGDCGTLHAKVALADRDLALVSSANLTDCALNFNLETGVLLRGPSAQKLAAQFERLVGEGIWQREGSV